MKPQSPRCGLCALAHVSDAGGVFCRRETRSTSAMGVCLHFWPAESVEAVRLGEGSRLRHFVIVSERLENRPVISGNVSQKCFTKQSGSVVTPGQTAMGGTKPVFKGANRWRSA